MPFSRLRHYLAQQGGAVSFRQFMEAALYDPESGYYSQKIRTVGRGGDFSTSATLSPHLGAALAVWLGDDDRPLIEIGPGSGALAESLLQALGWWRRRRTTLWLVEKSPVLRAQQQERLAKHSRVRWVDTVGDALKHCGGRAVIYSNELVDAFPVTLAEWRESQWREVWLEISPQGGLVESLRPLPLGMTSAALNSSWTPREGQRVEVVWSYREWMQTWLPQARDVRMLTIDYGGAFPDYLTKRLGGTLRGYLRQERREGLAIYENMGRQDLTADVCFDDLQRWGGELGLRTVACDSQAAFFSRHVNGADNSRILQHLMDEDGAGGAFQVLEQRSPGR